MNYMTQTLLEPYERECIAEIGYFDEQELAIFNRLIRHRRSLPVYLGNFWRCYDCLFESESFETVAEHIIRVHPPAPIDDDDE